MQCICKSSVEQFKHQRGGCLAHQTCREGIQFIFHYLRGKFPDEEGNPILLPTELRRDINYSIYFNWFRFVSLGIVPFALLVLFNAKIYVALRKRKQRRLGRHAQQGKH